MDKAVFEQYLENRFQQAGALTPSQKLDVLEQVLDEAQHEGKVPTGDVSVMRLPVNHKAVQAVLRGESVSLGTANVVGGQGYKERLAALPTWQRIGVLVLIVLLPLLLAMMVGGAKAEDEIEATPTPTLIPSSTPLPTATIPAPTLPPPPLPTMTSTPALLFGIGSAPADESRDPASIEIGGRLFIVSKGEVEEGRWVLQSGQTEWLAGTEVRRVFAIPYTQVQGLDVPQGSEIYVRTRGGQVITYLVRDVIKLQANQIETLYSLRPSIVINLPLGGGDANQVERVVIFGEAKEEDEESAGYESGGYYENGSNENSKGTGATYYVSAASAHLRGAPGLDGNVVVLMPSGTQLQVQQAPVVSLNGHDWLYVSSPYGYGWVTSALISQ